MKSKHIAAEGAQVHIVILHQGEEALHLQPSPGSPTSQDIGSLADGDRRLRAGDGGLFRPFDLAAGPRQTRGRIAVGTISIDGPLGSHRKNGGYHG